MTYVLKSKEGLFCGLEIPLAWEWYKAQDFTSMQEAQEFKDLHQLAAFAVVPKRGEK